MKEFIKKSKTIHLIALTCLSLLTVAFYFFHLEDKSLTGVIFNHKGTPEKNIIIYSIDNRGSSVSDVHGSFRMNLLNGYSGGDKIFFAIKERDFSINPAFGEFGEYRIGSGKEEIKVMIVRKGDSKSIFSNENLEKINFYLKRNSANQPLSEPKTDTPRKERNIKNYAAKLDDYYGLKIGESANVLKNLSLNPNLNVTIKAKKEPGEIRGQVDSKLNEAYDYNTYIRKLNLADHYYFNEEYLRAITIYKNLNKNWPNKDLRSLDYLELILRLYNAELLYFSSEEINEAYVAVEEGEYLTELKNKYNALLNNNYINKSISIYARLANDFSHLALLCFNINECSKNGKTILEDSLWTLESVPRNELKKINYHLLIDLYNAELITTTELINHSKRCDLHQELLKKADLAIHDMEEKSTPTYEKLIDLPLNLISALTIIADCNTHDAENYYKKAINLASSLIEKVEFNNFANRGDRFFLKAALCDLYSRSSSVSNTGNALTFIRKSLKCYNSLLNSKRSLVIKNNDPEIFAKQQYLFANANLKYSFYINGVEKKNALDKAIASFRESKNFFSSDAEYDRGAANYISSINNLEGYTLIELSNQSENFNLDRTGILKYARELILKAHEYDKNNLSYIDSLAWVDFKLGDAIAAKLRLEGALQDAEKRKSGRADLIDIKSHLAEIYLYLGETKHGSEMIQKIKQANPNAYQLKKLEAMLLLKTE